MPKRARDEAREIQLQFLLFRSGSSNSYQENPLLASSLSSAWVEEYLGFDESEEGEESEEDLLPDSFTIQKNEILNKAQALLDEKEFSDAEKPVVQKRFGILLLKIQNKKSKFEALALDSYKSFLTNVVSGRKCAGKEKYLPPLCVVYACQGAPSDPILQVSCFSEPSYFFHSIMMPCSSGSAFSRSPRTFWSSCTQKATCKRRGGHFICTFIWRWQPFCNVLSSIWRAIFL
jgi:hypothetical protein